MRKKVPFNPFNFSLSSPKAEVRSMIMSSFFIFLKTWMNWLSHFQICQFILVSCTFPDPSSLVFHFLLYVVKNSHFYTQQLISNFHALCVCVKQSIEKFSPSWNCTKQIFEDFIIKYYKSSNICTSKVFSETQDKILSISPEGSS